MEHNGYKTKGVAPSNSTAHSSIKSKNSNVISFPERKLSSSREKALKETLERAKGIHWD